MEDLDYAVSLSTDLYQLTMGASYDALGMEGIATFSLFVRKLPKNRSYLVAAGLEEALRRLTQLRFGPEAREYLRSLSQIRPDFVEHLANFRFTGDVWAVPEGRVVFSDEPLLEVQAPILQAQLVETILLNAIHFPTLVATKAARCVSAAPGKALIEFGLRRAPSLDAALAAARATYIAGFVATSNVYAASVLGIPPSGTVAHSFIEAFPSEIDAFRAFVRTYPGRATLLIDTYDTLRGARRAVEVARELASEGKRLLAVRIDSGDLAALSREVRQILDEGGLEDVQIVASGGLDEYVLASLTRSRAPIDAYGVGTRVTTSADAPMLDMAYKLVEYEGRPALKLSTGKQTLVGPKQVWRRRGPDGRFSGDIIAARDEPPPEGDWEPLLEHVVHRGEVIVSPSLDEIRRRHREEMAALPPVLLQLEGQIPYPVKISPVLEQRQQAAAAAVRRRETG